MRNRFGLRLLVWSLLFAVTACVGPSDGGPSLGRRELELDDMGTPPGGMELFVLARDAPVERVREAFERLHGTFLHHLPPRLVVGKVPAGAGPLLLESGVVQRFARAVSPAELPGLDTREARFVRVFSSRYYPAGTQPMDVVVPKRAVRLEGEPFEAAEDPAALRFSAFKANLAGDSDAEELERNVFVPYASGRIVVSVILPESNGPGEQSSENWSEDGIAEVYAKVQAAIEGIARHEPNAQLSYVLHYESAPAPGGLEGTVDVDFEYGKQAWGGANLSMTYAQIFSRILGREIGEFDYWQAQSEYLAALKDRYSADGAYIVYVAANQNFTAGFRAYANINGPSTSLDSGYGYETFMHEFGHIFGALDEYCPDACIPPSSLHGYLGMVNANAQYRAGPWGGVRGGRGEAQGSLMMYNVSNGLNGYTRGAFGWLDTDGDGVVEVRDTLPDSDIHAEVTGGKVHLVGRIVDVPATPNWATPYSVNRIRALQVRARGASNWVRLPVVSDRRGRADVDLTFSAPRKGHYELEVRGENSVGNLQPSPSRVSFDVTGRPANGAPLVSLSSDIDVLSPAASAGITASTLDLDGDRVEVRFDVDGDGRYDTPFSASTTVWITPRRAGVVRVGVQARDARGGSSSAVLPFYVLEENAPARPGLPAAPSPTFSFASARFAAVGEVNDPERARVELNYKLERDDWQRSLIRESGFDVPRAYVFDVQTPTSLAATGLDLSSLDFSIDRWTYTYDAVRVGQAYVVLALGEQGVVVVDLANRAAPRLVSRLYLETAAYDLALVGDRTLFVWGDKLTAVDLSNPEAPVEKLQARVIENTRHLESGQSLPVDEALPQRTSLWGWMYEHIEHVSVEIPLDHPRWEDLRITLTAPRGEVVVLWDHTPRPDGQQAIHLDDVSHEALATLIGTRASGEFRIDVIDDVFNGNAGTISNVALTFDTAHRAFVPDLASTQSIVGGVDHTLVLAGQGLETVDISQLDNLRGQAVLDTEYVMKAALVNRQVLALSSPQGIPGENRPRGLFAVDIANPNKLRVVRDDTNVVADGGFALAGSRLYVSSWRDQTTRVGSLPQFLSGAPYWLGQSPTVLGSDIMGDDNVLWVARGPLERIDVRNPSAFAVLEHYEDPYAYSTRFFDARTAFILGSAGELWLMDLEGRTHVISEVYRLTAQARDARGALSEVSRSVHVVPYDHAPAISSARFVRATTTAEPAELEVQVFDLDNHPSWDSYTAVRVDWDGDGIYDGPWYGMWDVANVSHLYEQPGDYQVRVQARDGFYALSNELVIPVHIEADPAR